LKSFCTAIELHLEYHSRELAGDGPRIFKETFIQSFPRGVIKGRERRFVMGKGNVDGMGWNFARDGTWTRFEGTVGPPAEEVWLHSNLVVGVDQIGQG
jgi:hypothetical protein